MQAIPPQSRAREPAGGFFANSRTRAASGSYTFNSRLGLVTAAGVMPPAGWNSDAASMRPVWRHASLKNSGGTGAGVANWGAGAGCCARTAALMDARMTIPAAMIPRVIACPPELRTPNSELRTRTPNPEPGYLEPGTWNSRRSMLFSARYGLPNYPLYRRGAAHRVVRARPV